VGLGPALNRLLVKRMQLVMVFIFLLVLIIVAGFLNRRFLSLENFSNLVATSVPYLLTAFAQTIILLAGGIDLSVGSMVSLSNVLCARFMLGTPFGFLPGLILALAAGSAAGYANGLIITRGRLQPIIVTLASSSIVAGLALAILPEPGGKIPAGFARIVNGSTGVPFPLIAAILVTFVLWIVLNKTRYGRSVYATGGNENAAYSSGVAVDRVKTISFVLAGFLSALAGVYISSQIYSGDPLLGTNMSLVSITTAVLGGTSLGGGKGNILGSVAGVFIFIIINNVLNLTGVPSFYQFILQGCLLIFALTIGSLRLRRR
jgi:ribose transport system permease protein